MLAGERMRDGGEGRTTSPNLAKAGSRVGGASRC